MICVVVLEFVRLKAETPWKKCYVCLIFTPWTLICKQFVDKRMICVQDQALPKLKSGPWFEHDHTYALRLYCMEMSNQVQYDIASSFSCKWVSYNLSKYPNIYKYMRRYTRYMQSSQAMVAFHIPLVYTRICLCTFPFIL